MERKDRIEICKTCQNKGFNPTVGIVCGLTKEDPQFEGTCDDYVLSEKDQAHENNKVAFQKNTINKGIRRGRIVLFVIGAFLIFSGIREGFYMFGADMLFAIIDWSIAALFIILGFWSFKKPSLAILIGLILYGSFILLLALLEPATIIQGILWKVIFISALIKGFIDAKQFEKEQGANALEGDALDMIDEL